MADPRARNAYGSVNTLFSTEAALANAAYSALSSAVTPSQHNNDQFLQFWLELQYTTAPTANRRIDLLRILSIDGGTNYEKESSTTYDNRFQVVGIFQPDAVTSAQKLALGELVPILDYQKFMLYNRDTGQSINANWVLKYRAVTDTFPAV